MGGIAVTRKRCSSATNCKIQPVEVVGSDSLSSIVISDSGIEQVKTEFAVQTGEVDMLLLDMSTVDTEWARVCSDCGICKLRAYEIYGQNAIWNGGYVLGRPDESADGAG
jgi:hypothetical protein